MTDYTNPRTKFNLSLLKDAYESGFTDYSFITRKDIKVCPLCRAQQGKQFKIIDAINKNVPIPEIHNHCRCNIKILKASKTENLSESLRLARCYLNSL